jgi:predicted Zn-ribbon and HTH transcriptional regulator
MQELVCNRCNHTWWSRVEKPRACPRCKTIYWNVVRSRPIPKKKVLKDG